MFRLLSLLLLLLVPGAAAAAPVFFVGTPCAQASDCPVGFSCTEAEFPCFGGGGDCACPPCPEGERCPPCDCGDGAEASCGSLEGTWCVFTPEACEIDADCSIAGFACEQAMGCDDGCDCPPCPDGAPCAPCDCDGDEERCTEGGGWCLPPERSCHDEADCLGGWECFMPDFGGGDCEECFCWSEGEGEPVCECRPCEEPVWEDGSGMCLPPGWSEQIQDGIGGGGGGTEVPGRDDGGELGGNAPGQNDGARSDRGSSTACAAGGGGAASLLGLGLVALGLRRRRA